MRAPEPHPTAQELLEQIEALDILPLRQYGAEGAREVSRQLRPDVEGPAVGDVTDREVPGFDDGPAVPVRIYEPDTEGPAPTVVFFHGGGFVIGDLESHDVLCRHLVRESDAIVVSVDYRRAPEHPFPAALEDAYAAAEWVADDPDALHSDGHLAVMGDSAGATLAAGVSRMARDWGGPAIDRQVLVYPSVSPAEDWDSRQENAEGYYLEEGDIEWFFECYYGSRVHTANPYGFPLVADEHAGLPETTVVTAGFDPLRDEGIAYVEALREDGVDVTHHHYEDMIHGFVTMLAEPAEIETAHEAVATIGEELAAL
ncbi:MAG: alpha/beta hydrolase [Halodesulfurarchaeum sp.]